MPFLGSGNRSSYCPQRLATVTTAFYCNSQKHIWVLKANYIPSNMLRVLEIQKNMK